MDTKQIALFSTSFLQYSQTFVYDELRFHQRYEADVFCNERLNEAQFPYKKVFSPPQNWFCQCLYRNIGYWPAFNHQFKTKSYSLVHAHFGTGAVYCLPYVKKYRLPFVVTFWGNDVAALMGSQRYNPRRWRYILKAKKILDRADLILAVSREMEQILEEYSGYRDKIKLYHHGVDTRKFRPVEKQDREITQFLLIGRFTQKKGHIFALKALNHVIKTGRKAMLTFIGKGELVDYCRKFTEEHNLTGHVRFLGALPHDEVAKKLTLADVLLAPSIVADNHDREGSPTVVKEAGACGVPVIGTYHAGIRETVIDGKTGFLVPERDVIGLAERMIRLIDHPALRTSMGELARQHIQQHFNARKQVEQLEGFYDQVAR